jgi:hypothetical protein
MKLSLVRALVFFLLGLPVGFILSALGFAVASREIAAPALAPYALIIAAICGIVAATWKRGTKGSGNA